MAGCVNGSEKGCMGGRTDVVLEGCRDGCEAGGGIGVGVDV
jgi:hypothetical protein